MQKYMLSLVKLIIQNDLGILFSVLIIIIYSTKIDSLQLENDPYFPFWLLDQLKINGGFIPERLCPTIGTKSYMRYFIRRLITINYKNWLEKSKDQQSLTNSLLSNQLCGKIYLSKSQLLFQLILKLFIYLSLPVRNLSDFPIFAVCILGFFGLSMPPASLSKELIRNINNSLFVNSPVNLLVSAVLLDLPPKFFEEIIRILRISEFNIDETVCLNQNSFKTLFRMSDIIETRKLHVFFSKSFNNIINLNALSMSILLNRYSLVKILLEQGASVNLVCVQPIVIHCS